MISEKDSIGGHLGTFWIHNLPSSRHPTYIQVLIFLYPAFSTGHTWYRSWKNRKNKLHSLLSKLALAHSITFSQFIFLCCGVVMTFWNITEIAAFLTLVHATTTSFVRWSFGWLVYVFYSVTSLLLPQWSSDLKYGPCPPARSTQHGNRLHLLLSHFNSSVLPPFTIVLSSVKFQGLKGGSGSRMRPIDMTKRNGHIHRRDLYRFTLW